MAPDPCLVNSASSTDSKAFSGEKPATGEPSSKRCGRDLTPVDPKASRIANYYRRILSADDMQLYLDYFLRPLPTTFRVSAAHKPRTFQSRYSDQFGALFHRFVTEEQGASEDVPDNQQLTLQKLPWIPGGWMFTADKRIIRLSEKYKRLHKFINLQHEAGFIVRQEAVSMIPPVFLQACIGEAVLDVCAAPGSKTLQLLEDVGPTGLLIANDADLKRCYVLVHNTITVSMPSLVITNCDASRYPSLPGGILFDKVLADVPCSGDGTLRKAPDIWHRWSPHGGLSLHPLQLRILLRSLQLLKVGGIIVYSTCSLNPIENEAVVAAALQICQGSLEVLDASHIAPSLVRSPGLATWPVVDPVTDDVIDSVSASHPTSRGNIYQTMFPYALFSPEEDLSAMHASVQLSNLRACDKQSSIERTAPLSPDIQAQLIRTMRFYPWLQDTGGFYVALLKLVKPLPPPESSAILAELINSAASFEKAQIELSNTDKLPRPPRGVPPPMWQDLPMQPLKDPGIVELVRKEYDLPENFIGPYVLAQRQPEGASRIIMISEKVANIFLNNTTSNYQTIFRIVIAGCGCFQKQTGNEKFRAEDGSHIWRIPQSSAPFLLSSKQSCKRVLPPMPRSIFMALLSSGLESEETTDQTVLFTELSKIDAHYVQRVKDLGILGQCIVSINCTGTECRLDNENIDIDTMRMLEGMLFCGWIGAHSLGLHVQRRQRAALYEMISAINIKLGPSRSARQKAARKERREQRELG